MPIGKGRGCSARSGPTPSPSPSSCRRPTSPARSTSAMRSTITLQDILVRHARMQGKDSLWVVGMDHAGIATQMVVERNLDSQGISAPRSAARPSSSMCGNGKAQSGGQITRQLRRLGASCDWANERFTMDEGFSAAVDQGVRRALQARPALSRQAAGQLGPQVPDRDQRPRGRDPRGAGPFLAPQISARRRSYTTSSAMHGNVLEESAITSRRHHPARDDAGRHGGRGSSRGRALSGRWSASSRSIPIDRLGA